MCHVKDVKMTCEQAKADEIIAKADADKDGERIDGIFMENSQIEGNLNMDEFIEAHRQKLWTYLMLIWRVNHITMD